jgi:hypothetical protein
MPQKLMFFLAELAANPDKLAEYNKDRDSAMEKAQLDPDEREALKSGSSAQIYASLMGHSASHGHQHPPRDPENLWGNLWGDFRLQPFSVTHHYHYPPQANLWGPGAPAKKDDEPEKK